MTLHILWSKHSNNLYLRAVYIINTCELDTRNRFLLFILIFFVQVFIMFDYMSLIHTCTIL